MSCSSFNLFLLIFEQIKGQQTAMEEVCCGNDTTSTPVSSPKTETQPEMELIASNAEVAGSSGSATDKNEKKKVSSPKKVFKALHGVVVPKVSYC
jgi:hypothetical protein